jgi:hypothetical protein
MAAKGSERSNADWVATWALTYTESSAPISGNGAMRCRRLSLWRGRSRSIWPRSLSKKR